MCTSPLYIYRLRLWSFNIDCDDRGERYNAYTISFNDEEPSPSYSPSFHQNTVTPWSTPEDTKPLIPFTIPTSSPTSSATDSTYSPSLSETPSLPDSMVYTFPIVPRIRSTKSARDQSKARFSPYTQSKRSSHTRAHPHSLSHTRSTSSLTDTSEIYPPTPYSCHPSHQMLEAGTLPSSSSFSSNVRVAVFEPNETLYSHLLGRPSSMNGVYPIEASVSYDDYLIAAHAAATPTSMSSHTQQLWEQTCIGDWLVTPPSRELYALPH